MSSKIIQERLGILAADNIYKKAAIPCLHEITALENGCFTTAFFEKIYSESCFSRDAFTNPLNNGCGRFGLDFNSG